MKWKPRANKEVGGNRNETRKLKETGKFAVIWENKQKRRNHRYANIWTRRNEWNYGKSGILIKICKNRKYAE